MAKRIMRSFTLGEISGVDRPAQKGATRKIMKREAKTKTEGGKHFPASDYAYVPDPEKPSTWKLRLTSEPGAEPDPAIVGAAAAALGPGYRGQKVDLPSNVRSAVVARVRAAWRKANPDKEDTDMPNGIAKAAIGDEQIEAILKADTDQFRGATTFSELMVSTREQQSRWKVNEDLWPLMDTLGDSFRTIIADMTKTTATKAQMMRQSVDEFFAAAIAILPDAEEDVMEELGELAKAFNEPEIWLALAGITGDPIGKKENDMPNTPASAQSLEKQVGDLTKSVAALAGLVEGITKAETLTQAEKDFAATLTPEQKKKFMDAEMSERETMMAKAAGDNPVVYKSDTGEEFRKNDDPRLVAYAKQADEDRKIAKAEREARQNAEFAKRADDEYGNVVGSTEERAAMLKAIAGMPDDVRKSFEAVMGQAEQLNKANMITKGHGSGTVKKGSPDAQLDALAKRHQEANPGTSYAKAYDAVLQTEEGSRLYSESREARPGMSAA